MVGKALRERATTGRSRRVHPVNPVVGGYVQELRRSGLLLVAAAFASLIAVNLVTLAVGPSEVLAELNASPLGAPLAPLVFDSWGTIGGLGGMVLLFAPVLFATPVSQRRELSLFFIASTIGVGELAGLLWDWTYDTSGRFGSGSSGIAVTGLGIIFALSAFGLLRLVRQDTRQLGALSSHWWYSFALIDLTLILTSLWFILSLEPIFVPTTLYNWRVHEFGFLFGAAAATAFAGAKWSDLGLDGVLRIDETLMNFHFDDLCARFPTRLPKYHVAFRRTEGAEPAEFSPERGEIWVDSRFRGREYGTDGGDFERALLHAMVHAELLAEGRALEQGRPDDRRRFEEIAEQVGAPPEP